MSEVTIKPTTPIVPGRPSWFVYRDGEFVARVWEDADDDWTGADALGLTMSCAGAWEDLCAAIGLPTDTSEPTPAPEAETVEVRCNVAVWTQHQDDRVIISIAGNNEDDPDAVHSGLIDDLAYGGVVVGTMTRHIAVVPVPLPAKPAEIVGEVVHVEE